MSDRTFFHKHAVLLARRIEDALDSLMTLAAITLLPIIFLSMPAGGAAVALAPSNAVAAPSTIDFSSKPSYELPRVEIVGKRIRPAPAVVGTAIAEHDLAPESPAIESVARGLSEVAKPDPTM